jgi:hypothetical protein
MVEKIMEIFPLYKKYWRNVVMLVFQFAGGENDDTRRRSRGQHQRMGLG